MGSFSWNWGRKCGTYGETEQKFLSQGQPEQPCPAQQESSPGPSRDGHWTPDLWQFPFRSLEKHPQTTPCSSGLSGRRRKRRAVCSLDLEGDRELFPRNPHKFEINTPAACQGLPAQPPPGTHRANPHVPTLLREIPGLGWAPGPAFHCNLWIFPQQSQPSYAQTAAATQVESQSTQRIPLVLKK